MKKYKILKDSSVNSADIKADDCKGEDWLHDDAKILDSAKMFGRAGINNSASIYGRAQVYGDAEVYNEAKSYPLYAELVKSLESAN